MNARVPQSMLNAAQALNQISRQWDGDIVRQLSDYIAIPAKSPMFDAEWAQHGYLDTVVRNAADWVAAQKVDGLTLEIMRLPGRTPVLFFEVPASRGDVRRAGPPQASTAPSGLSAAAPILPAQDWTAQRDVASGIGLSSEPREAGSVGATSTVLMYGHLDKQPEFTGWRNDLGPWTPKYEDGKLYGRGGADDGYAVYASIAAVQALKAQNVPHPRIVGLVETCEESGSYDLLPYVDALRPRLGDVDLVICLD